MFELLAFDLSTVIGGFVLALVLGFLRFGNSVVDVVLSYGSSPVETVEKSLIQE